MPNRLRGSLDLHAQQRFATFPEESPHDRVHRLPDKRHGDGSDLIIFYYQSQSTTRLEPRVWPFSVIRDRTGVFAQKHERLRDDLPVPGINWTQTGPTLALRVGPAPQHFAHAVALSGWASGFPGSSASN